ncbi:MAG: sodium:calcium antiporter [Planctomycetes bacterium]|nr:sodium:calcium antiporter [Planctomycetota bacterium]
MLDLAATATALVAVVLASAIATLVGGAKWFTAAAERVGLALGLSPFAVGIFIVAIGTSLPELVAAVVAMAQGNAEVVSGNVLGANTALLLLVLGVVATVSRRGIQLGERYIAIDLNFLLAAAALLSLTMVDGRVGRLEGVVLLCCYGAYTGYLLTDGRTPSAAASFDAAMPQPAQAGLRGADLLALAAAAGLIFVGANVTLDALLELAGRIGISPAIASLTILSLGTTLPELAVSIAAALRGRAEMAVGNILGSCIFNSFSVVGVAALVGDVVVPPDLMRLPLPCFLGAALLFYLLTHDRRVSRWEGALFVFGYLLLVAELAGLA